MKYKLQQFMAGRNGIDDLGKALNILVFALMVGGMLLPQLSSLGIALFVVGYFRIFSRDTYKRSQENAWYLSKKNMVTKWFTIRILRFKNRKMYLYFKCPSCGQDLRVPKGKGDVIITCPICKTEIKKRS